MALDRFVYWQCQVPNRVDITTALTDYIGDSIGQVRWYEDSNRWYVTFHGKSSHPSEHLADAEGAATTMRENRCFEVYLNRLYIDVITRDQSPLIQAIADGFVKFAVRYWKARLEVDV